MQVGETHRATDDDKRGREHATCARAADQGAYHTPVVKVQPLAWERLTVRS
jgi:hypothetical protein